MKTTITIKKSLFTAASALAILFSMTMGELSAQANRYGALAGRNPGNGNVSGATTHCVRMNMLSNDRITDSEATFSWNSAITADAFKVVYTSLSTGISNEILMGPGNSYVNVQGLAPAEQYKWYVETICATGSHISNMMKFSTLAPIVPRMIASNVEERNANPNTAAFCPTIGVVRMLDMSHNKIILSWSRTTSYDSIRVRYAPAGTTNYRIMSFTGTPNLGKYFLMGLTAQTAYDITVNTYCNGTYSAWSTPITITTLTEPAPRMIADKSSDSFKVYPNPASKETTLSFNCEKSGVVNMNIYDITGKEVFKSFINTIDGINEHKLDLTKMYKGIYMVKLSGNNINSVQRIVVQ